MDVVLIHMNHLISILVMKDDSNAVSVLEIVGNLVFDIFYPNKCLVCNQLIVRARTSICVSCLSKWTALQKDDLTGDLAVQNSIDSAYVSWEYGPELRTVIHFLKYENRARLGKELGLQLANKIHPSIFKCADGIIPVPLHKVKLRERGYNQAFWIARGLSGKTGLPVWTNYVQRMKYTETQTVLNRSQRKENMQGAFIVSQNVSGKTIILVDDVLTTGSTLSSMAVSLKSAGAVSIIVMTVVTPVKDNL